MTERIIDRLEFVDVDVKDRKSIPFHQTLRQPLFDMLAKRNSIGQIRQRIKMSQMSNPFFRPNAFRYVFVSGEPAAAGDGFVLDLYQMPVASIDYHCGRTSIVAQDIIAVALNVTMERPSCLSMTEQISKCATGLDHFARQTIHLDVSSVAYNQPFGRIKQKKPLAHVANSCVEPLLFDSYLALRKPMLSHHLTENEVEHQSCHQQ